MYCRVCDYSGDSGEMELWRCGRVREDPAERPSVATMVDHSSPGSAAARAYDSCTQRRKSSSYREVPDHDGGKSSLASPRTLARSSYTHDLQANRGSTYRLTTRRNTCPLRQLTDRKRPLLEVKCVDLFRRRVPLHRDPHVCRLSAPL